MTEGHLALDLGNTNITLGLYRDGAKEATWRLSTDLRRTADEWAVLLKGLLEGRRAVGRAAIASVVPTATEALRQAVRSILGTDPLIVDHRTPGVRVKVDNPASVGADRLANAVGARRKYALPAIVVDFGTATNFDVVDGDGAYIGGALAPGVGVATEALLTRASRLPGFDLVAPPQAIGRTTVACLQSGVIFGFSGLVDHLVDRIRAELAQGVSVVATGGYAALIAPECRTVQDVDMDLTVDGIHDLLLEGTRRAP